MKKIMAENIPEEAKLTDIEMAEAQGDKDICLAVISAFGDCKGCSANCHKIAEAQLLKAIPIGVTEGRKLERAKIFKEIEKRFGYFTEESLAKIIIDDYGYYGHAGSMKEWQALKEGK